jgi:hypothetical protein
MKAHRVVRHWGSHIFLDNRLTVGGEVVSLTHQLLFTPQEDFWYSFLLRGWVDPWAIVRLEGLLSIDKPNDLIRNWTCDLPACSVVPQPTTLPCAPPQFSSKHRKYFHPCTPGPQLWLLIFPVNSFHWMVITHTHTHTHTHCFHVKATLLLYYQKYIVHT